MSEKKQESEVPTEERTGEGDTTEYYSGPSRVLRVPLREPIGKCRPATGVTEGSKGAQRREPSVSSLLRYYMLALDSELAQLSFLAKAALFLYVAFLAYLVLY